MERNKQKKTTTSISTDGGYRLWHSLTGNKLPQEIKKKYIYSTLSLEKTKDLYKALMQIFQKKKEKRKIYNNKKENKK